MHPIRTGSAVSSGILTLFLWIVLFLPLAALLRQPNVTLILIWGFYPADFAQGHSLTDKRG
jgi:hypothetical protein